MSCHKIQRRLYMRSNPEKVPAAVRHHLAECPACREVQRRLLQVERMVPMLAVPSSSYAKAALLRKIKSGPSFRDRLFRYVDRLPEPVRHPSRWQLAGAGVAAALLLIVIGWKMVPGPTGGNPVGPVDSPAVASATLLDNVLQRQLDLAEKSEPRDQVAALAGLADDLHGAALSVARAPDAEKPVADLARWYGQIVKTEEEQAKRLRELPPGERKKALDEFARRLDGAAKSAEHAATDPETPDAVRPLFQNMAAEARKAREALEELGKQEASLWPTREELYRPAVALVCRSRSLIGSVRPASVALAAAPAVVHQGSPAAEAAKNFLRDRDLIEILVAESQKLAAERDPIEKARHCQAVAQKFATAIQTAAAGGDGARAEELGKHLGAQMKRGVAANLEVVVRKTPASAPVGSARDRDMLDVAREVAGVMTPLEDQLQKNPEPQAQEALRRALRAVYDGRTEIEKTLKGRNLSLGAEKPMP